MTRVRPVLSEADFQQRVIATAQLYGWRIAHFRPAKRANGTWYTAMSGHVGFPDLVLARHGEVIFAELKSERGHISLDQDAWIYHLGERAHVWRPSDWDDILAALAVI